MHFSTPNLSNVSSWEAEAADPTGLIQILKKFETL